MVFSGLMHVRCSSSVAKTDVLYCQGLALLPVRSPSLTHHAREIWYRQNGLQLGGKEGHLL